MWGFKIFKPENTLAKVIDYNYINLYGLFVQIQDALARPSIRDAAMFNDIVLQYCDRIGSSQTSADQPYSGILVENSSNNDSEMFSKYGEQFLAPN